MLYSLLTKISVLLLTIVQLLFDFVLNIRTVTESILNIELHPAYFAYAVKAPNENMYSNAHIEHLSIVPGNGIDFSRLSEWLKSLQNIWNRSYQKVYIAIHGYPVTVTPDKEGGVITLQNIQSLSIKDEYFIQSELINEFILTFSIPETLKKLLDSYFVGAAIVPSTFGICKHILKDTHHISQLNLHITPGEGHFFYVVSKQPKYFNTFRYKNKDDLLYFTLLVYKMLELEPDSYPLSISGLVEKDSEVFKLLYQYIRNIYTADFPVPLKDHSEHSEIVQPNYLANLLFIAS